MHKAWMLAAAGGVVWVAGAPGLAQAGPAWADEVVAYEPAFGKGAQPRADHRDAAKALGPAKHRRDVSLGQGGLLELAFVQHVLTNSGDAQVDLKVMEVGPDVEQTYVALLPADAATAAAVAGRCQDVRAPFADGFCEIGRVEGGSRALDVDALFPGHAKGTLRFSAVQLVDDAEQGESKGPSVGADIAGVAAFFHLPAAPAEQNYFAPVVTLPAATPATAPAPTQKAAPVRAPDARAQRPAAAPAAAPASPAAASATLPLR
jgi:hypothetical protein